MLEWISMVIALSMPYQGPLADRQMQMPDIEYVGVICPIDPLGEDGERVRLLAKRLEREPIAVRAPDHPELGYGLLGNEGHVFIVGFNLMLVSAVQQIEASGTFPPGEDDGSLLAAARVLQGGLPNTGDTVEWALGALASFDIRSPAYPFADIDEGPRDFPALVADWKTRGDRYDEAMVRRLVKRWGLDPQVLKRAALAQETSQRER